MSLVGTFFKIAMRIRVSITVFSLKIGTPKLVIIIKVLPDLHFGSFYPKNLVPDPQKLGARILRYAYMINVKLYLWICI